MTFDLLKNGPRVTALAETGARINQLAAILLDKLRRPARHHEGDRLGARYECLGEDGLGFVVRVHEVEVQARFAHVFLDGVLMGRYTFRANASAVDEPPMFTLVFDAEGRARYGDSGPWSFVIDAERVQSGGPREEIALHALAGVQQLLEVVDSNAPAVPPPRTLRVARYTH